MNFVYHEATGKTPLVILHGLFGSSRNWKSFSQKFSSQFNIPVFALDLRNHNLSSTNNFRGHVWTWSDFRNDLKTFVKQHIGAHPFSLLGHSLGGQICLSSLLSKDTQLSRFVSKACIVDISLKHPTSGTENDQLCKLMLKMKEIESLCLNSKLQVIQKLRECESNEAVINFLLTNLEQNKDGAFKFSRLGLNYILDTWSNLKLDWENCKKNFTPWNGKVHFIKGEYSKYIDEERGDVGELDFYFPSNRIHTIHASGHWPHFDNPGRFFSCVGSILTDKSTA